ncbi:GNAT family N-acetyltransferase [Agromyces humatus]|uniref:GNAT family N-acetyltransferase n=1 Tax=Agromyces humatus TaxID=279573 RepID=A0ABP4X4J3_9MICO|nr:GNAT family N-acetyltransferase [Agromyces humatus]
MPDLLIRLASPGDAAALAELAADTFPLACPPSTTAEAITAFIAVNLTAERMAGYLADVDRTLLVAHEPDGHFVGYTMLIAGEPGDTDAAAAVSARPAIELSKFYTRALAHGSGVVAGPLMSATLEAAAATGAASAWLGVNEENARAIRFYEKHGFAKVGRKHFRLGDRDEDDWVLERPLAPIA